jgi:hypothetical protein
MSALPSFSRRRLATAEASAPSADSFLSQRRRGVAGGIEADGDRHQLLHHRLVGGDGSATSVTCAARRRGEA